MIYDKQINLTKFELALNRRWKKTFKYLNIKIIYTHAKKFSKDIFYVSDNIESTKTYFIYVVKSFVVIICVWFFHGVIRDWDDVTIHKFRITFQNWTV